MSSRSSVVTGAAAAVAVVAGLALGCGGKPAPAPVAPVAPAPAPPPAPAPKPVCIVADDATGISHAAGDEHRIEFCLGATTDQCFALDLASGNLSRLAGAPAAASTPGARIEAETADIKVCAGDTCKTLTPKIPAGSTPIRAATNADGTSAVVLLGDAAHGKGYAEIWDVAAAKKQQTFRYAKGDFKCGTVHFLGPTIFVSASTCTSPDARGQLFTAKGKRLAAVGARELGTYGDAFAQLDGNSWAFLGENGTRISVQDVVTGKITTDLDLSLLWRKDGAPDDTSAFGNPGESALLGLAGNKLAVIAGSPANGSVAIVDVDSGEVTITHAALCAPSGGS